MSFDPSRRAVLRAALGVAAYWGLGAVSRPTVWARLPEIYDGYRDPVTTTQMYRLRTGDPVPDLVGSGKAMWASRMEYLLYRISRGEEGVVPHVLNVRTGRHRALAPGPCRSFVKAHSGARVYFAREGALWMQSMTAVFRGVDRPQRVASLPVETRVSAVHLGVSPEEREVYLAADSGSASSRVIAVDLASGETREITELPAPVLDLQVSPYEDGTLLMLLGASTDKALRSGAVRIDGSNGSMHSLPTASNQGRWRHLSWWGRGHVLGIEERPAKPGAGGSPVRRAVSAEIAPGSVRLLDSVPAHSIGGSPDGRRIVMADADGDVWVVDRPTGERRLLAGVGRDEVTDVDPDPSFTPDGRGVLMKSDRFGPTELLLAQLPDFTALPLPYERSVRRRRN